MNSKSIPGLITILLMIAAPILLSGRAPGEGDVLGSFPEKIDPDLQYMVYLHGRIIEEQGIDPISPQFGLYEFTETLEYFAAAGFAVIGEVRTAPLELDAYADHVVGKIKQLIEGGVPADQITVVGFSKGALIAILVSDRVGNPDLKVVLIGICNPETISDPALALSGRILSLYEMSDPYGASCQSLADRSPGVVDFQEISFHTGKSHGAFYPADPSWMDPVLAWMAMTVD